MYIILILQRHITQSVIGIWGVFHCSVQMSLNTPQLARPMVNMKMNLLSFMVSAVTLRTNLDAHVSILNHDEPLDSNTTVGQLSQPTAGSCLAPVIACKISSNLRVSANSKALGWCTTSIVTQSTACLPSSRNVDLREPSIKNDLD